MDMKALAELPKEGLIASLRHIETAYRIWIKAEAGQAHPCRARSWRGTKRPLARAVRRCTRALERIKAGIDLIETNPLAEEAFRFANRAMWQQRIHSTFSRKVRKKEMKVEDGVADAGCGEEPQLAFVPDGLRAAQPAQPDRSASPGPQP